MTKTFLVIALVAFAVGSAWGAPPVVTNVVARQRANGTGMVDITYNLSDPDSGSVYVSVAISTDGGSNYSARSYVTGHIGWVVTGGPRSIVWDAKASLGSSAVFPNCKARVTADDSSGGVYPGQMIYIPAGSFQMGNNGSEPYSYCYELPQHSVNLAAYYIGKYEVTRGEYQQRRGLLECGLLVERWLELEGQPHAASILGRFSELGHGHVHADRQPPRCRRHLL